MKTTALITCLLATAAWGQEAAKPAETKPAGTKPAQEQPAPAEATGAEPAVTGSVEIGFRFLGDIRGNRDAYRSVVNLQEGVRLLNMDFAMSPSLRWIDDLAIRANSWGDPYNTAHLRAAKQGAYRLEVDYRNIAYFNSLPSFANPNLERGLLQSQRTFDMTRRFTDVNLELLPGKRIVPFLGYTHDAGFGRGVTLYVPTLNEYAVPNDLRDKTDTYRGGVRLEFNRFHATLEQGGFYFKDDQRVYEASQRNPGNRTSPFLGQPLFLQNLQQAYGVRGDGYYSRIYASANPTAWLDIHGSYVYTRPDFTTKYFESATGQFAQSNPLAFFTAQQALYTAVSKQPHNRGSFSTEIRPVSRVRILQSLFIDRIDTTGSLSSSAGNTPDRLLLNFQQHQVEALVEVAKGLTLRGGHRYTWGNSETRTPSLAAIPGAETSELKRNTALAGITYRFAQKVTASLDAEIANTDKAYFRTSLMDYQRFRARLRFAPTSSWSFLWSGAFLNNDTPNTAVRPRLGDYDLVTLDNSLSFFWMPKGGDKFRLMGEYARQNWRSDILYLAPQTLTPERSHYRENVHAANLMADIKPAKGEGWAPRFSLGGSMFRSAGSRPTYYYQPVARVAVPVAKHVEFLGEWRWWGLREPFYLYENFRNHQGTISLRIYQ